MVKYVNCAFLPIENTIRAYHLSTDGRIRTRKIGRFGGGWQFLYALIGIKMMLSVTVSTHHVALGYLFFDNVQGYKFTD